MSTECTGKQLEFHALGRRAVIGQFDGGQISSDGGALLLREVEKRTGILARFARCFVDHRDARFVEHSCEELVAQRVMGLALGYEDLNDHDELRHDPLMAVAVGKAEPSGEARTRVRDRGKALAGKSTLNRLELTRADAGPEQRYKKVEAKAGDIDSLLVDLFIQAHRKAPKRIVIDLDATDDPLHGNQEGRFFHGYYGHYCYLPLYIFCGEHLLCARLRTSDIDGAAGSVVELQRIVGQIRTHWPTTQIIIRGDSGFCRDDLMTWCEINEVDYVLGLAKNARLIRVLEQSLGQAEQLYRASGQASRVFEDFEYRTRKSWTRARRVVGKAEHLAKGANPRFVVTSLSAQDFDARSLYEELYCARGDMENRIKEQQLALFADRTSTATMRANQLRLYFSSMAYCLMQALRRLGLTGTSMAKSQCDTIRLKLFKVGAQIRVSVRKVWVSFSESYPHARLFEDIYQRLLSLPLPTG